MSIYICKYCIYMYIYIWIAELRVMVLTTTVITDTNCKQLAFLTWEVFSPSVAQDNPSSELANPGVLHFLSSGKLR